MAQKRGLPCRSWKENRDGKDQRPGKKQAAASPLRGPKEQRQREESVQKWGRGQGEKRAPSPRLSGASLFSAGRELGVPRSSFCDPVAKNEMPGAHWGKERAKHMGLMVWEERMRWGTGRRAKEQPFPLPTWTELIPARCRFPSPYGLGAPGPLGLLLLPLRHTPLPYGPVMPLALQPHFEAQAQRGMDPEGQ